MFALLVSGKSVAAEDDVIMQRIGSGDPATGRETSESERCQECHGQDGNSDDGRIPSHAGQYAGYLIKQLRDFQSGARKHPVMSVIAEDLSEADMADIAAYFASQKRRQGSSEAGSVAASNLFSSGDQVRAIEACANCHGEGGKGRSADNVIYPAIGGQHKTYLSVQLVNWKLGERSNSPDGVMNRIAKALTDDEIEALSTYLSGL
ncbi:c-type cytochrome [Methylobacter sp. YRD-M1]|uniref:c-type cytochrome n=1 Tax=Methylobacter sp. YRD-M1 TaxID=2911520 RepID=UPI00227CA553|nr:c-type cytochrome [Methylobacter sp. YRD-M1]WAK02420.1 cytochrome c4 [Methylobacter sp. YRD-M1]